MGLLDRPGDRDESLVRQDRRRQVFGVGVPGLVECLADGAPESIGGQAGRQRVDRDDPAGVEDLRLAGKDLELRVVQGQLPPEVLDLPGHDDLAADRQSTLDEAPPEPRGVDGARVVLEPRDRALDPSPEPRLHADVAHRRLDRDHRAVLLHVQVADDPHLAQVVVAARKVEEQVADRVEVEADAGATELGSRGQPRLRERRVEELDGVGRRRGSRRSLAGRRGLDHRPPYSAEIRYR